MLLGLLLGGVQLVISDHDAGHLALFSRFQSKEETNEFSITKLTGHNKGLYKGAK